MNVLRATIWFVIVLAMQVETLFAAEIHLHLPLARTVYQDNEWIDISVLRSPTELRPSGELLLKLSGADGSQLSFVFPVDKVDASAGTARAVEHLHVNGWLLRPGDYTVEVACDGAMARANITVFSHIRRSSFKLINWGRAKDRDQLPQGEENLGFNLFYGQSAHDDEAHLIRAGVDFMGCCVMSGGHQMDLRSECDWSDPLVIRGGTRRATQRAFVDRTRPNVWGVHFYDEPGLTWAKDPDTGKATPHVVPWQLRQYEAAFGQSMLDWKQIDPANPEHAARWAEWARWKLGFMDAAWQDAQYGVSRVRPDYVSLTQSQYGYSAFTDGYYFNVVRSLPIVSGHGGYHDWGPGYFNPSMFLEFARARDLAKPNWYLPTWYGNTTSDEFRLEQCLSFQCNLQGLISPPDLEPADPTRCNAAQGIVETNQLAARLGPIFNTMPVSRPPVALLYSLSQFLHTQTADREVNYAHNTAHGRNVMFTYLAGKLLQHQFLPLLDEEVLDGTLLTHHKAIILTSLDHLDGPVTDALENFVQQGGLVLMTADCTVAVEGAVKLAVTPAWPDAEQITELKKTGKDAEISQLTKLRQALAGATQLADAIRPHLEEVGIRPPLTSTEPGIVVTRQASGDVEYLFAVNATHDPQGDPMLGLRPVLTTLTLPVGGGPVYDVVHSQLAPEFQADGTQLHGDFRFGPGQMRVFARTARPIGRVAVATPVPRRDFARYEAPVSLDLTATVLDGQGGLVSGSVPLRVRITDPLGATRYDLYRATTQGVLSLRLPLAANDPAGQWKVVVTEQLSGAHDTASITLDVTRTCSAAAGATRRAVHWSQDRENIFRFFRQSPRVTLVTGSSAYNQPAAERLTKILEPWNVHCNTMSAAEANMPRPISETAAATWIGLDYTGRDSIKPGDANPIIQVGIAVPGPVILLGTPDDNPLIKLLVDRRFLPYQPDDTYLPGSGRGYVAWQRDGLGVGQESLTLIAYDADGLNEAVGTTYEFLAGLAPLTPLAQPTQSVLSAATTTSEVPELAIQWTEILPDRVDALKVTGDRLSVLTHDRTRCELGLDGKRIALQVIDTNDNARALQELRIMPDAAALAEAQQLIPPTRLVKLVATKDHYRAVACWGGHLCVFDNDKLMTERRCPQDLTALTWSGDLLIAGDADGRVMALRP